MSSNKGCGARAGWRKDEEDVLFLEVERGRNEGLPLKAVFERVAAVTGRKPNSIRNYYYARVKDDGVANEHALHSAAFVPFTVDEMRALLRTVLAAQAAGVSVRSCTLDMGAGDNKAMLRYQNKYRSLIRSNPQLVREVMADMKVDGLAAFDPYASKKPGHSLRGRHARTAKNLVDVVSGVVNDLDMVEGLDVQAFFEALGALAVGAGRGSAAMRQLEAMRAGADADELSLKERCAELKEQLESQEHELIAQRERFAKLMMLFRQLMNVNREFLGMTGVTKMSSLSNYVRELSRNVEDCERLMTEYVN